MASKNGIIFDSFVKAKSVFDKYDSVTCSISGGADSDLVLDLCTKLDIDGKIKYAFFNTGLEYAATKSHLEFLESKYGVSIDRLKAVKSVPVCCREYGQPFISKYVSTRIERLQRHGFQWEDEPYEVLMSKYDNCKSALQWWCNKNKEAAGVKISQFDIEHNVGLKEFLVESPPPFKVSAKCCEYAKKKTAHKREMEFDLLVTGVRKGEGGLRATAYKSCYETKDNNIDQYRPLFWYKNDDKKAYEDLFGITHSECYTRYGLRRTGCTGCPYGVKLDEELEAARIFEPNLYKACNTVFKDSYEYTRKYREFVKKLKNNK